MKFLRCFRKKNCHNQEAIEKKAAKKAEKEDEKKKQKEAKMKKDLEIFEKKREKKIKTA